MSEHLTEKQQAVLDFIEGYQMINGKSPTIREMKENFNVKSDNSILKHLKALTEKGAIEKDDTPRGIKLLDSVKSKLSSNEKTFEIPIIGTIPAGNSVMAEENIEGWMGLSQDFVKDKKNFFLLTVTGNSMINAGINEGDLVLVDMNKTPRSKDIVVALVDNENTLKRLITEGGQSYLKAENPEYNDIYPAMELRIQGVVTTLIRQY